MQFEWDERKAAENLAKHGVPFAYVVRAFLDPHRIDEADERRDYKEDRRVMIGKIDERVFVVAYTLRGKFIRLISARKANPREQRKYNETLPT